MRHGRVRGFSMMEILIASTLLEITGALMLTSISSSIDAKQIIEAKSTRLHQIRQAMTRMVDEISMAYLSAHTQTPELRVKTEFLGDRDELQFTALGYVRMIAEKKESDQHELGFFLGQDERTGVESLLRRNQPNPDDEPDEGGRVQTLLPDVTDLLFEYWDPTTQDWKETWNTEDSSTGRRLPARVRITFTARLDDDREQTFTTQTKIWLQKPMPFRS